MYCEYMYTDLQKIDIEMKGDSHKLFIGFVAIVAFYQLSCYCEVSMKKEDYIFVNVRNKMEMFYEEQGVTWQQAYDKCVQNSSHLAVLDDKQLVKAMEKFFIQNPVSKPKSPFHVWIAGRRHRTTSYHYLDGLEYEGDVKPDTSEACKNQNYCAAMGDASSALKSCKCSTKTSSRHALCQYKSTSAKSCELGDINAGDYCYHLSNNSGHGFSWYGALNYCRDTNTDGTLALGRNSLASEYLSLRNSRAWVGVITRPWVWMKSNTEGSMADIIQYYHWHGEEGDDAGDTCIHLEGVNTEIAGCWADKSCNDRSYYFMCQTELSSQTPTTIVTTIGHPSDNKSVTTGKPDSTLTNNPREIESTDDNIAKVDRLYLYAALGVISCLVLVIIALVVIFVRRNRKKKKTSGNDVEPAVYRPEPDGLEDAYRVPLDSIETYDHFSASSKSKNSENTQPTNVAPCPKNSNWYSPGADNTDVIYTEPGPASGDNATNAYCEVILDDMRPEPEGNAIYLLGGSIPHDAKNKTDSGRKMPYAGNMFAKPVQTSNKSQPMGKAAQDMDDDEDIVVDNPTYGQM